MMNQMATFHVFVDGAVDASPDGLKRLATAMASRYGLQAADLVARISKGRFRVKANVDRATADTYFKDLQAIGARVVVEDASAPGPAPAVSRTTTPLPPRTTAPPASASGAMKSGLAAAFSGDQPSASLGALGGESLTLASLDGVDDAPEQPKGFAPPAQAAPPPPSRAGLPPPKPAGKPAAKPNDAPLDLFAPPEQQQEAALTFALEPEEEARVARKKMSTPPAQPVVQSAPAAPASSSSRRSAPAIHAQPTEVAAAAPSTSGSGLKDPRVRFAAGIVLSILLGFIPAHLLMSAREGSAFKTIDDKVIAAGEAADTIEAYGEFSTMYDQQLARKQAIRRNLALMSFGVWALVGGGLAFVWFRKIPWDRG
jgi:hypothetical protein